jgi:hypothetical protein
LTNGAEAGIKLQGSRKYPDFILYVPVAQRIRASVYETEGRWFKSSQAYQISPHSETDITYRFERYSAGSIPAEETKSALMALFLFVEFDMRANELLTITKQAIAKRNREQPNKLFDELIDKMKSQAKNGYSYINFVFSDPMEIVNVVLDRLQKFGYTVSISKKQIAYRISWEQTKDPQIDGILK